MPDSLIAFLGYVLSFFGGFFTAIFAEPIRRRLYRPKLRLEFGDGADFVTPTPIGGLESGREGCYIRVKVLNVARRTAGNCRGYLIAIDKKNRTGDFRPTAYCDSIPLAWSCRGTREEACRGIDLPYGVNQFLDVLAARSSDKRFEPQLLVTPYRYMPLFSETGVFRFTVQVAADGADPRVLRLILHWTGDWQDFDVYAA